MRIFTQVGFHGVKKITAKVFENLPSAPLIVSLEGDDFQEGEGEITIYTQNLPFAVALARAINSCVPTPIKAED